MNATYYSDVRVPVSMRIGDENGGWRLITTQLNHERVMLGPAGRLGSLHDRVADWARATLGPDGQADRGAARRPAALAEVGASLRINELLNWQVAVAEKVHVADASATKVFSLRADPAARPAAHRARRPARRPGRSEPTAELMRWLDVQFKRNLVLTFGGGVNEVQRELIAMTGLGCPGCRGDTMESSQHERRRRRSGRAIRAVADRLCRR